jgi:hypothetical protein
MNKTIEECQSELSAIYEALASDDAFRGVPACAAIAILKIQRDTAQRLKERFTIFHTDGTIVSQGSFNALISQNDDLKNRVAKLSKDLELTERLLEDERRAASIANWGSTPCQN